MRCCWIRLCSELPDPGCGQRCGQSRPLPELAPAFYLDGRAYARDGRRRGNATHPRTTGGQEVKIAAITASVFSSERDQVLASGMDDFIPKPYRPEEIFACMRRQLGARYRPIELTAAVVADEPVLRHEDVAALPSGLRQELQASVVSLNHERILAAIDRVEEVNRTLAAALRARADEFAFTAIFNAIKIASLQPVSSASSEGDHGQPRSWWRCRAFAPGHFPPRTFGNSYLPRNRYTSSINKMTTTMASSTNARPW